MAVVFYANVGGCMAFYGRFAAVGVVLYRVRACGGWCSRRGLLVFLPTICVLHVAVFGVFPIIWKNSSREALVQILPGGVGADPAGAAGVRFLLKKRTKKRKHENV